MLLRAHDKLTSNSTNYNDLKAGQLCEAIADLLMAEARIEAWMEDLGTTGCSSDESSIGGLSCLPSNQEI